MCLPSEYIFKKDRYQRKSSGSADGMLTINGLEAAQRNLHRKYKKGEISSVDYQTLWMEIENQIKRAKSKTVDVNSDDDYGEDVFGVEDDQPLL